jgi:inner membrane protein
MVAACPDGGLESRAWCLEIFDAAPGYPWGAKLRAMDSLTQIALGASLAVAVMGRRTAVWKAALWGGVAGLLPDLDVLIDHGDAISNMVRHRAESHSLFYLTLAAPLMAWAVDRLHRAGQWRRWCLALWLAMFTHPLLDLMTVYGTQALQPFTHEAYGLGSMFIIDPLYTLPLLLGLGWALAGRSMRGLRANAWALAFSTAYLAWSALAQAWVLQHAKASLAAQGLPTTQVMATPAPFQTWLWRIVAIDSGRFHEGYYAFLDGGRPVRFTAYDRGGELLERHAGVAQVQRMARFSDGYYKLYEQGDALFLADLRMGQQPYYAFDFRLGPPAVNQGQRADVREGLRWLGQRLRGQDVQAPGA